MMRMQKANPGGTLAPDEVVGRDELVEQLWRRLERQSLYITAERRMGKSSVVRDKMGSTIPAGWTFLYLDVSNAVTPLEFVEVLLGASRQSLSAATVGKFNFLQIASKLAGLQITAPLGFKLPDTLKVQWKTLLTELLQDLENLGGVVVLAFDELPLMLDAIQRREGAAVVMEILDTLRAVRQMNSPLRMIYTGSLGIHHILSVLREQGYQNEPINDMYTVNLEPLTEAHATELVLRLLYGESVSCDNYDAIALHIAQETDRIPFYIQHVVAELGVAGAIATQERVNDYLHESLNDGLDRWNLVYYDERIDTHYLLAHRQIARATLDMLATQPPKTVDEITEGIDPARIERDRETVLRVLRLLGSDHYTTVEEGRYRFRSAFIQRVWRSRRGLGE
ncbi:MAG: ATP-binding protein [Armatimonadetes bacterium]|nr:ATP-binding protein [Armatimonadota bacterium]